MANSVYDYSSTSALANGTTAGDAVAENATAPSAVNNAIRGHKYYHKLWLDDQAGVNQTVGGTANAITLTTSQGFTAYGTADGQIKNGTEIAFKNTVGPNTAATTINVNAIGIKKIRGQGDVALAGGEMVDDGIFRLRYDTAADAAAGAWILLNPASSSVADASTTAKGIIEIATNAEVLAGTDAVRAVTPATAYFPTGYLSGFLMTPAADAANDFSMAVGSARSSDDTTNIVLGSALIKQIDATWVVGTNQGGRFFTTLTAGSKIYAYVIKDPVNNLIDWGYSDNASDPTGGASYPAAYTKYARVASFWRSAGSVNQAPRILSLPSTDWVAYTPTFTSFGTVASVSFFSRRDGPNLEILGKVTTGTMAAPEARITMGFNGTDGNVLADATVIASIRRVGQFTRAGADIEMTVLAEQAVSYMTFSRSSGGGFTKVGGTSISGTGEAVAVQASIPIAGW
jgi:hypothetical protein